MYRISLCWVLVFLLAATSFGQVVPPGGAPPRGSGSVVASGPIRVIEADTIETWINGNRVGIGLMGITAPAGNTECGREAIGYLYSLLRSGLLLEEDQDAFFDRRGRRMYYALAPNRVSVARQIVRNGMARASNEGREAAELRADEQAARQSRTGCLFREMGPNAARSTILEAAVGEPTEAVSDAVGSEPAAADMMNLAAVPSGFSDTAITTGLDWPTAFAFLPDGRILIAQKRGDVRLVKNGVLMSTPVIDLRNRVNDYWDHGLLGIAVDPNFTNNGFIYLLYTYENNSADYNGTKTGRLARYTLVGDTAAPATEVVILGTRVGSSCDLFVEGADCIASESPSHSVGYLKFASDGSLFVTLGDAGHFNFVDDRSVRAQQTHSLAGKVLRITTSGQGLTSNPFYPETNDVNSNNAKIWAYGLRNPYRFTLRPGTETPYLGDVGWNTWEELNSAPPRANLGWPCYEGDARQSGYETKPICQTLYSQGTSGVKKPLFAYSHNTGAAAVTGGTFYTGTQFPSEYRGDYFYGDYSRNFIRRLTIDAADQHTGPVDFATNAGGPVAIEMGPDGAIYYLAIVTGEFRVIRYTVGNTPPTAVASAEPTAGLAALTVQFSSAGSNDGDGDPLTYAWSFGDGGTSAVANPSYVYAANGTYSAVLTVSDGRGGSATSSMTIVVGNRRPTPSIAQPGPTLLYKVGDVITISGSASDPEDGSIPPSRLSWQVILHHCPGGVCHTHSVTSFQGASGNFPASDHEDDSHYEIILTATDSGNLTAKTSVRIQPATVRLTLNTIPAGLQVQYGSISAPAPLQVNAVIGGTRSIGTISPQSGYTFVTWSDSPTMQRNITVPTTNTTYTASFTAPTGGALTGVRATPSGAQNLTAQGTLDWAHWGQASATSFNHKAGVTQQISNFSVVGSAGSPIRYTNNPVGFTWTGGTPTASATNTTTGVYLPGLNNGFRITVPADTTPRRLVVYVGVYQAQGRFTAELSDTSASNYADTSISSATGIAHGMYTLDYKAASSGQTLTVMFTQSVAHTAAGNVTISAATLASIAPDFQLSATPSTQSVAVGSNASYTVNVTAINGFSGSVNLAASGLPAGANAAFSPATVTGTSASTLAITTAATTPSGSYPITIQGTSGTLTKSTSVTLTLSGGTLGGALTGVRTTPSGVQNLTAQGMLDWAHWGQASATSFNHKAGVTQQISNFSVVGGAGSPIRYTNNPVGFTWTGGTPTASATNTTTGVYLPGLNNGFRITVPADTTPRRLVVYVGVYQAQGRFTAQLSDTSASNYADTSISSATGIAHGMYTLDYKAASSGQTLTVMFTQSVAHTTAGNVTISAATLASIAPDFQLSATPSTQSVAVGSNASYTVNVTAINGFSGSVNLAASDLPAGANAAFSPATVTGTGASTLAITTAATTPSGSYPITIRGTSGTLTKSTSVTLTLSGGTSGGALTGVRTTPSGAQNLTAQGMLDWAHWGQASATSFNHKAGVTQQISNFSVVGGAGSPIRYTNNPVGFTWTGGTPTASATNTTTGVYLPGLNNGFRITVPADTTPRRLVVYVGVYQAQGRFTAQLSDTSASNYADTSISSATGIAHGMYTLDYKAASSGQTLTVMFTQSVAHTTAGNVTISAATLR